MDFAIVVLDEFLYEGAVLVQDLVSHVGDVMEDCLILHLRNMINHRQPPLKKTNKKKPIPETRHLHIDTLTMKFCCSGDHEYMTGTEATALSVFSGMTWRGNSKPLSTVHCTGQRQQSELDAVHTSCRRAVR